MVASWPLLRRTFLVRAAIQAGAKAPFLMANENEERIYARVGFVTEARILHISI